MLQRPPPATHKIYRSGRYASYWNAFLLLTFVTLFPISPSALVDFSECESDVAKEWVHVDYWCVIVPHVWFRYCMDITRPH